MDRIHDQFFATARISRSVSLDGGITSPGPSHAARTGMYGAIVLVLGTLLSGPLGLILVAIVHPAGDWHGARILADNYHPIQTVPFLFGLVLVIGCDLVIAAAYGMANERQKTRALLAVMCAAAFTGLIVFNYICQTTFVPALLSSYRPEYSVIISTLSLANPRSLAWAIEMWGWGLFGFATWLVAPVFRIGRLENATSWAFKLNGFMSVLGAFITAADLTWVLTAPGMVNFVAWNILMMIAGVLAFLTFSRRAN